MQGGHGGQIQDASCKPHFSKFQAINGLLKSDLLNTFQKPLKGRFPRCLYVSHFWFLAEPVSSPTCTGVQRPKAAKTPVNWNKRSSFNTFFLYQILVLNLPKTTQRTKLKLISVVHIRILLIIPDYQSNFTKLDLTCIFSCFWWIIIIVMERAGLFKSFCKSNPFLRWPF